MDLEDQQRAAKSIAYLASVGETEQNSKQQAIITNTLMRLLSEKIPLTFTEMNDDPGKITFGYAKAGVPGIYINKDLIPAGNQPYPKDKANSRHVILATIPHEVSHQVNGDINKPTYEYFQAEYRAWYIGWLAEYNREPTKQEAFDRCIDLINIYPNIQSALFDKPEERAQMLAFMNQMRGVPDINLQDRNKIIEFLQGRVKDGNKTAPVPDPKLNHDMDN